MKLKVRSSMVPPGTYMVKLLTITQVVDNLYGVGLRFVFVVVDGPYAGRTLSRLTGPVPAQGNACGKIIGELLGRCVVAEEEVDLDALTGGCYLALVKSKPDGWSRIEKVSRLPGDKE